MSQKLITIEEAKNKMLKLKHLDFNNVKEIVMELLVNKNVTEATELMVEYI